MTKVIILGQEQTEPKKLKPIEFVKYLTHHQTIINSTDKPSEYGHIELICKGYSSEYDVMFAYNNDRGLGTIFLGYFNDGVVEE